MLPPIGILGAGGQARELASFAAGRTIAFHAVTADHIARAGDAIAFEDATEEQRATPVVVAVGAPGARRRLVGLWPGEAFATVVAAQSVVGDRVEFGGGTFVAPGAVVTTDVRVGRHVIINVGATVSHDTSVGDFVTIAPGAHIGGSCRIGDGVVVGIGANIRNGVSVAAGVVIGAGAVVVRDIPQENAVVAGCPARRLRTAEGWADEL
ncbi:MAG: hypothetical protein ACTHMF_12755 [Leifsonia sp.]|uniref:hypothetical protein n=1 Tax=Leifsonia sp. TaxID=1870902 RepID=UPI003F819B7A